MMVRPQVKELCSFGRLPSEVGADLDLIKRIEDSYRKISRPLSDAEARVLVRLFGDDGCFGLAASLMHLVETAPSWPLVDCLSNSDNVWIAELRRRASL
jgi:hypothetical protein